MKPSRTLAGLLGTEAFQQLQSGKGRGAETREEQSRNNSAALGQGPGSTSSNTHRSVFKLFFRAVNKTPTKWKMFQRECHSSITLRSPLGHYLIKGGQALHTPRSLSATLPSNSAISSQVGTHRFSGHDPASSPFAWQSNKAIIFYFIQNSVSEI